MSLSLLVFSRTQPKRITLIGWHFEGWFSLECRWFGFDQPFTRNKKKTKARTYGGGDIRNLRPLQYILNSTKTTTPRLNDSIWQNLKNLFKKTSRNQATIKSFVHYEFDKKLFNYSTNCFNYKLALFWWLAIKRSKWNKKLWGNSTSECLHEYCTQISECKLAVCWILAMQLST